MYCMFSLKSMGYLLKVEYKLPISVTHKLCWNFLENFPARNNTKTKKRLEESIFRIPFMANFVNEN